MLYLAGVFLTLSAICAYLGFWAIPGASATAAQAMFILFFVLFLVSLVAKGTRLPRL